MQRQHVLITGGAGFIGSHVADELLRQGHRVRVLDCLSPQVHGPDARRPDYLHADVELVRGDVRDRATLARCLHGIDQVVHFAAKVGVGQSMHEIEQYTDVNNDGTAILLEALVRQPVQRLLVASSMSIYGEGLYHAPDGTLIPGTDRPMAQLRERQWEMRDAVGTVLTPVPTPETKPPSLASVYALSKFDQEQMCLIIGRAYGIPTVALRFFNVYGPRQSLANPYTGVLAIFASRLLGRQPCMIFEDGGQQRDFVHVHDVARACGLALSAPEAVGRAINIGSGQHLSIREVAEELGRVLDCPDIEPEITQRYRCGDVRHCFADIGLAQRVLGFEPAVSFREGVAALAGWLEGQIVDGRAETARREMLEHALTV